VKRGRLKKKCPDRRHPAGRKYYLKSEIKNFL
jgi:hypothetical protein